MGKREIVACDFCILHWHLDCLDPPLASAPNKKLANGKPRQTWMCPNHVDQELAHLKASATPAGKAAIQRSASIKPQEYRNSRSFRTRRPKKAKVVEIGLRRGFRNNGMIEIVEEHSEEESEIEKEISGVVYRVPEKGIKLDFIDRVKRYFSLYKDNFDSSADLSLQFQTRSRCFHRKGSSCATPTKIKPHPNRQI